MHPSRFPYQKPPRGTLLNKSHPLVKDLIGCFLFNEYYEGQSINLIDGVACPWTGGTGPPRLYGDAIDFAINGPAIDAGIDITYLENLYSSEQELSVALECENLSSQSNLRFLFDWRDRFLLIWGHSSAPYQNSLTIGPDWPTGINFSATTNVWKSLVGTYGNGTLNLYENGVLVGTGGAASGIGANSELSSIGKSSRYDESGSRIRYCYIWKRPLSAGEAAWLAREPYAMFHPQQRSRYSPTTPGPVTNTITTDLSAYLKKINIEISSLLRGYLQKEFTINTDLTAYIEQINSIQTDLTGYLKQLDVTESSDLTAYLTGISTATILTNLTAYLQQVNQSQTSLRSHLKTIDNERSTDLTAYTYFALEVDTTLRAFLKTVDNLSEPALLRSYIQKSDIEISSLLSSYLIDNIEVQTDLTSFLVGQIGSVTDLSAYLSKIGVLQQTLLSGFLVESDRIPHACFKASGREKFIASPREKFKASPDLCKDKRRII